MFFCYVGTGRTEEACSMVNSLRKVDFSHPTGHYTWRKSPPPPLRKSWMHPCITQPFFEDVDLKLCTHIHRSLPSNMLYVFFSRKFWFLGERFSKIKIFVENYFSFEIFKILKIRDNSLVALLILCHIVKDDWSYSKLRPLVAFLVNPYCWYKSAKHDVTLTSFTTDSKWHPSWFVVNMCRIVVGRGTSNFKAKLPVFQELFVKNHRGSFSPPAGRGLTER